MGIKTFVLTGGPQSGKTTLLAAIREEFGDQVLIIPEVASVLLSHLWPAINSEGQHHSAWLQTLQRGILHTQLGLEELISIQAEVEAKRLVCQDRGLFDGAGYLQISGRVFARRYGVSFEALMEHYDLVIHLDTIARVRPDLFGKATNSARYETVEEAVMFDECVWEAYREHPNHVRNGATEDFGAKSAVVFELIRAL